MRNAAAVMTAAVLSHNDAATTGELHLLTRKALDRMWTLLLAVGVTGGEKSLGSCHPFRGMPGPWAKLTKRLDYRPLTLRPEGT